MMLRLVALLAFAWFLVLPVPGHAYGELGKKATDLYQCSGGRSGSERAGSPYVACVALVAKWQDTCASGAVKFSLGEQVSQNAWWVVRSAPNECGGTNPKGDQVGATYLGRQTACPTGSSEITPGSNTCECEAGTSPNSDGECTAYTCPAKNSYKAVTQPDVKLPNAGDGFCESGCKFSPSSWKVDQSGQVWGVWPFKSQNSTCGGKKNANGAGTGSDDIPPAPVACGPNQCPGNVNGTDVCVPCRSQTTNGPSTAASGTQPSDPKTGDPAKDIAGSTTKTDCTGAVCTTTTTYTNANGDTVGSKTEETPAEDYCQKNPTANQCKKDSFGGACDAGFQCEGDAVQCALAREVHVRNCQWFKEPPKKITDAGDAALAGGDPSDHPIKNPIEDGLDFGSRIDRSDALGAVCPSDIVVPFRGTSLVVPLADKSDALNILGNVAVAACLLAAAFIVFRD